jgi:hypothetical protein
MTASTEAAWLAGRRQWALEMAGQVSRLDPPPRLEGTGTLLQAVFVLALVHLAGPGGPGRPARPGWPGWW